MLDQINDVYPIGNHRPASWNRFEAKFESSNFSSSPKLTETHGKAVTYELTCAEACAEASCVFQFQLPTKKWVGWNPLKSIEIPQKCRCWAQPSSICAPFFRSPCIDLWSTRHATNDSPCVRVPATPATPATPASPRQGTLAELTVPNCHETQTQKHRNTHTHQPQSTQNTTQKHNLRARTHTHHRKWKNKNTQQRNQHKQHKQHKQ